MAHTMMLQRTVVPQCAMHARQPAASRSSPCSSHAVQSFHSLPICTPSRSSHSRQASDIRVRVFNFKFGKKEDENSQPFKNNRGDYNVEDVEDYFNYMGMLAVAGNYDGLEAYLKSGMEPPEILLLWACAEDDLPKVEELLGAGAKVDCKGLDGKGPLDLAKKPEIITLLQQYAASQKSVAA